MKGLDMGHWIAVAAVLGIVVGAVVEYLLNGAYFASECRRTKDDLDWWKLHCDGLWDIIRMKDLALSTMNKELATEREWREALRRDLATEVAKKKCTECRVEPSVTFGSGTMYYQSGTFSGTYVKVDPEAERVAKLPKYGSTKKCPACGHGELMRTSNQYKSSTVGASAFSTEALPAAHQYMIVECKRCRHEVQERPLFNSGKGK
jgi:predicted RNA-binding Zn-ribbon protein involved in translation (DUF1610 family)